MRLRFPRFRISTLLLLITVMAMGIALLLSLRRERRLIAENLDLNRLVGRPVVTDRARIAVGYDENLAHLNLAFDEDGYRGQVDRFVYRHRFRIYQPPNRQLVVRCAFEDKNGDFPPNASSLDLAGLAGDELMLDVVVHFDRIKNLSVNLEARSADPDLRASALRVLQTGAQDDHWIFAAPYGAATPSNFYLAGLANLPLAPGPDTPVLLLGYAIQLEDGSPPRNAVLLWIEDKTAETIAD